MPERAERLRALIERLGEVSNRDVARTLRVSAATSHRVLRGLFEGGVLERRGRGPAARYRLRGIRRRFQLAGLEEDRAWEQVAAEIARIRPLGADESLNLRYAATEMLNNAIEHSRGAVVRVAVAFEPDAVTITTIEDDGIGVFRRVCEDFGFRSPHDAIVQLEKGKLTSDPAHHSGEGIFFSSKAVSAFRLESQGVAWIVDNLASDTAIGPSDVRRGTRVVLTVATGRLPALREVFGPYTDAESLRFVRTRTTVKLGGVGTGLISRSEARRLVQRLTEFTHVTLDFSGIDVVGQGFCDEVFRVFARRHPQITLEPVGMNDAVAFMVARARATPPTSEVDP